MPLTQREKEIHKILTEGVREAIAQDNALRQKYEMTDRFRFVSDKLLSLQVTLNAYAAHDDQVISSNQQDSVLAADEMYVYVYLFNSQGAALQSWAAMLTPKLFYEYSINRPIYTDRDHIENLLKSKINKIQHSYITVAIKKNSILAQSKDLAVADRGVKIKEGSLLVEKFISLTHDGKDYRLTNQGILMSTNAGLL